MHVPHRFYCEIFSNVNKFELCSSLINVSDGYELKLVLSVHSRMRAVNKQKKY